MQDEKQFEQLMLQYNQLKNGAEDIHRMILNEDFDSAMTMIKSREEIFLSCKCIRKYLELTSIQERALNKLLDELRELELDNIRTLSQRMVEVQEELRITHKNEKIQQAYEFDETLKGNIINVEEWRNIVLSSFLGALFIVFVFCCDYINAYNSDDIIFFAKKVLALLIFICIIVFVEMRKEFYHEQRRISTRNFKKS